MTEPKRILYDLPILIRNPYPTTLEMIQSLHHWHELKLFTEDMLNDEKTIADEILLRESKN